MLIILKCTCLGERLIRWTDLSFFPFPSLLVSSFLCLPVHDLQTDWSLLCLRSFQFILMHPRSDEVRGVFQWRLKDTKETNYRKLHTDLLILLFHVSQIGIMQNTWSNVLVQMLFLMVITLEEVEPSYTDRQDLNVMIHSTHYLLIGEEE